MHIPPRCRGAFVLLILLAAAGCTRAPAPAPAALPTLVGAWRSAPQFSTGAFAPVKNLQFLYVFNAGGTMVESSNYDENPPVPPAYGEWRETGPGRFEARYTFFTTNPPRDVHALTTPSGGWSPAGYGVVLERIQLAADGRSYESTLQLALFDAAGRTVEGGGQGNAHGTRAGF